MSEKMKNSLLPQEKTLQQYIDNIVDIAYPELRLLRIRGIWKRINALAQVTLSRGISFEILCSIKIKPWPEPALYGLLGHELSHIVLRNQANAEQNADLDVIARGMGPYLAVERIFASKYLDHVLQSRQDRYIGYNQIRKLLTHHELVQLNMLVEELGLTPSVKYLDGGLDS